MKKQAMIKKSIVFITFWFVSLSCVFADGEKLDTPFTPTHHDFISNEEVFYNSVPPQQILPLSLATHPSDYKHEENRTLYFIPTTTTFVRDAEYFLPYTKGYTSLGFNFDPTFLYKINEKAIIQAGIHIMGIAGDHKTIREISPIISLEFKPTKWFSLVGGSLGNGVKHKLYEPMYDFDRYFYDNQEMGLEAIANTKIWTTDMWCNWEDFIVPGSDFQERFTFGWKNDFHIQSSKNTEINIPVHLMMNHRGGQIDAVEDTCIETLMNVAMGVNMEIKLNKITLTPDIPVFFFSNRSNEEHIHTHYKDGFGVYPQICIANRTTKAHHWKANVGYWYGDKFISGRGSYLFQSRAYFDDSFERRYRHMITGKACYNYYIKGFNFGFEIQAYYDIDESAVDYAAGIYMRFEELFKIHSFKKR